MPMYFSTLTVLRVALLASLTLSLAGCDMLGFRDWSWRQKLTVTVETPTGVKTGSAVTAARMEDPPKWWGAGDAAGAMNDSLRGEAVVVDLGPAAPGPRYLFALLKGYSVWTAYAAFFPDMAGKPMPEDARHALYDQLESLRATEDLPRELYPLLITFADINDPASVSRVDPDDLAAHFGPGYALSSITLAITDETVTKGRVEAVLGWWCDYRKKRARLNGSTSIAVSTNELSDNLGTGAFRIGECS